MTKIELSAQQLVAAANNKKIWGDLIVNVLDYKVAGDGKKDDTAALQSLINSVTSGTTIVFPPGRYKISAPIVWGNKTLHLFSWGDAVIVEGIPLNAPMIQMTNANNSTVFGLTCEGAETLAGFAGADAKHYAFIKVITSANVTLTQLFIKNKTYGIYLDTCYKCEVDGITLEGFLVTGSLAENGANYSSGANIKGGEHNIISNLTAKNMGSGVLAGGDGRYHMIENIYLENIRDNGIYISSGEACKIAKVHVTSAPNNAGVKARGSKHVVRGCTVKNAFVGYALTGNGLTVDSLGYNGYGSICEGNTAENCSRMGLEINSQDGFFPRDFKVLNNNFINCGEAGTTYAPIKVVQGSGHQIKGNLIDGSPSDFGILINGAVGDRSKKLDVSKNVIRGNAATPKNGIRLLYVDGSTIAENNFENLLTNGVDCRFVDNSLIDGNVYLTSLVVSLSTSFQSNSNIVCNNIGSNVGMDFTKNIAHGNIPTSKNYHSSIVAAPYAIGQKALVSGVIYEAVGTGSTADWKQITN
ncbi:glycosyl hydrolase family 28-related protein [Paenibacillus albus]|nr:glycosyl hydrolase family 28-related protein [Paenibacillus albus]